MGKQCCEWRKCDYENFETFSSDVSSRGVNQPTPPADTSDPESFDQNIERVRITTDWPSVLSGANWGRGQ